MTYDANMLAAIFGSSSFGETPAQRAESSERLFVRSQMQLGFDNPKAKGRRLRAEEALELFGYDALQDVATKGRAHLFKTIEEPARTLRDRRRELDFSASTVAKRAKVTKLEVELAETTGRLNSIHVLERIASALVLDERVLTVIPGARGDAQLGANLRPLEDSGIKDEATAAVLAEAAWVVGRQGMLQERARSAPSPLACFQDRSDDYEYKTFERGYRLAARTRAMLGLSENEPIVSMRHLVENDLGLPIVQAPLGNGIAGATIVNGTVRGIVLSAALASTNKVLLRRTTIAHELGHALWDPDAKLGRIKVDSEKSISTVRTRAADKVEMRARSFAIALLAPTLAVRRIYREVADVARAAERISMEFGVSVPAAIFHLRNACRLRLDQLTESRTPRATHVFWDERERPGPSALDLSLVPIMRRGRFAELVVAHWRDGRISDDTASSWLQHSVTEVARSEV